MSSHLSIATEGLAPSTFSHRLFAALGFGYSVEVIVTPIPVPPVQSGGGGRNKWSYEEVIPQYDITFIIRWDGKLVTRSYKNILFDTVIGIVVKFNSIKDINIYASFKELKIIKSLFDAKLSSSKTAPVDITVHETVHETEQEKQPIITVKQILK